MIETDLYSALIVVCPRTYAVTMPQDVSFPALRYLVVNDTKIQAQNTGEVEYRSARIQVDVFSKTYAESKTMAIEVINKVIDLKGGDIAAQDLYDQETGLFRQIIDFKIRR